MPAGGDERAERTPSGNIAIARVSAVVTVVVVVMVRTSFRVTVSL